MSNWNFYPCDKADHDNYRLDRACIDPKCNKHQLVCTICSENEHQFCNPPSIKSFLMQFKQQLHSGSIDQDNQIEELISVYEKIENQMELTLQNIQLIVDEQKKIIKNVKDNIKDHSQQQNKQKQQKEKLVKFEQNMNQENYAELIEEIEDFRKNANKFQFSIKKAQGSEITKIEERIQNGNKYAQQYINSTCSIIQQFKKLNEDFQVNLQNYFYITPNKPNDQEQLTLDRAFSFSRFKTPPRAQDIPQNTSDTKNTNRNIQNQSGTKSPDPTFNLSSSKQVQSSQIPKPQQQETNSANKIPSFFSTIPLSPNQRSIQRSYSPLQSAENRNQVEQQTALEITQESKTLFETSEQEITKLLFLSNQLIAACCGTKCIISEFKTLQQTYTINLREQITDAAYMEFNHQNGILVLATKKGNIELRRRTQDPSQPFIPINDSSQINYQSDKSILVSINQLKKQIVTLEDKNIIKIFQVDPFKQIDSFQLTQPGTVLHVNSDFIYVGCKSRLIICDMNHQYDKYLDIPDINSTIISINTQENNLLVGLQDRINVFQRRKNGDYFRIHEYVTGEIRYMNSLTKLPIVIVLRPQQIQKKQVFIYDYKLEKFIDLETQMVKVCAVREDDGISLIGLTQGSGQCVIYKVVQTSQPQQTQ
ncbi:unnamed protein product (macronuclear) [Paramecium tetraurelia]|uniref:B box-type domain-containing protein n=1 Tax=Paramecium tetraurelia TaxID=5888 RepID=A0EH49_PARTE|nr:uncharacterized protein GSPATT00026964001 [Paramecium tetraurelia]CAK94640.1 unnamed protein product [Paramecium tetraurelia]|eukprot:XP_001462013.1 hypothetical protein (macronuclear) [Paramecium tetraurelia strain d4-2]